jgi:glycosyltransferase involved in cell wall biosynthesis
VLPFILILLLLSKVTRKDIKIIYWPFEIYGHQNSKSSYFIKKLESLFINQFDLLITQNDFRSFYYKTIGRTSLILVVRNYKPIRKLDVSGSLGTTISQTRQLVYIGSLIKGRNLENFISAVLKMEDVQMVIYAKKKASSHFLAEHHNLIFKATSLNKLIMHDEVNEILIPEMLLDYKVGIISYENNCLNNFTASPTKLTEYLNAGLVCILPDFPVFNELLSGEKFQIVTYREETDDFTNIIESAFEQFNEESRILSMQNSLKFDWSIEIKKFIDSLDRLIK